MGKLLAFVLGMTALLLIQSPADAACTPGTRVSCACPNGARGSQICEWTGLTLSLCACGALDVPELPSFPDAPDAPRPRRPRGRSRDVCPGLGFLIPGGIELALGTGSLVFGIDWVNREPKPALGVVAIAGGGIQMAVGLPLTIVGIVCLASGRSSRRGSPGWKGTPYFHPTATGLFFQF